MASNSKKIYKCLDHVNVSSEKKIIKSKLLKTLTCKNVKNIF